ncbi:hypothetical protein E2C01_071152 [Portunus trituberculatus]|uniref:Uncharacterized protein n=1 Tax=Portunus trituberculatus TaxID=210409 RepID=A0A5B7I428_PORTR|nr:hypothetical protein [Portunus trituberculatus]
MLPKHTICLKKREICEKRVILMYSSVFCNKTQNFRQNTIFVYRTVFQRFMLQNSKMQTKHTICLKN